MLFFGLPIFIFVITLSNFTSWKWSLSKSTTRRQCWSVSVRRRFVGCEIFCDFSHQLLVLLEVQDAIINGCASCHFFFDGRCLNKSNNFASLHSNVVSAFTWVIRKRKALSSLEGQPLWPLSSGARVTSRLTNSSSSTLPTSLLNSAWILQMERSLTSKCSISKTSQRSYFRITTISNSHFQQCVSIDRVFRWGDGI